jgi:hypothetical protein
VQLIARENAKAVYDFAGEIFAVTGLAHGSLNSGFIQKVRKTPEGEWTVEKWRALPGAPRVSWLLVNNKMLVSCVGGIVMISAAGEIEFLTRKQALR